MVPVHSSGRVSRGRIERLPGGRVGALRAEDLADGDQPFDQRLCQDLWRKVPLEFTKNQYHNGHPDLLPKGAHPRDALQHHHEGIEIKGSRYRKAWQGHNAEDTWLMVFVFDSDESE